MNVRSHSRLVLVATVGVMATVGTAFYGRAVFGQAAVGKTGGWLDTPLTRWNQAGAVPPPVPGSETHEALQRRCGSAAARMSTTAVGALRKAGWVPYLHVDRQIVREDVEVVGGMSAASPGCEPTSFNLFVVVGGAFAGTISPVLMTPSRDGAAGAVRIASPDMLTAEFARYAPADAECCPSSRVRVTYRIERAGNRPVLIATESRAIR